MLQLNVVRVEATVNLDEDDRQCRQTIYHRMRVCNCTQTNAPSGD